MQVPLWEPQVDISEVSEENQEPPPPSPSGWADEEARPRGSSGAPHHLEEFYAQIRNKRNEGSKKWRGRASHAVVWTVCDPETQNHREGGRERGREGGREREGEREDAIKHVNLLLHPNETERPQKPACWQPALKNWMKPESWIEEISEGGIPPAARRDWAPRGPVSVPGVTFYTFGVPKALLRFFSPNVARQDSSGVNAKSEGRVSVPLRAAMRSVPRRPQSHSAALCWMDRASATTTRCDSSTRGTFRNWCPWRTMSPSWWKGPWGRATPRRRGREAPRVSTTRPFPGWWRCWRASWSRPSWWMLSGTCWSSCPCSGTGSWGKQVSLRWIRSLIHVSTSFFFTLMLFSCFWQLVASLNLKLHTFIVFLQYCNIFSKVLFITYSNLWSVLYVPSLFCGLLLFLL